VKTGKRATSSKGIFWGTDPTPPEGLKAELCGGERPTKIPPSRKENMGGRGNGLRFQNRTKGHKVKGGETTPVPRRKKRGKNGQPKVIFSNGKDKGLLQESKL